MKIAVVGNFSLLWHEKPFVRALRSMGHEVVCVKWPVYLAGNWLERLQEKFLVGPALEQLGQDLSRAIQCEQPDVVFVWRGTHLTFDALQDIRTKTQALLVSYYNDNPFGFSSPILGRWKYIVRAWQTTKDIRSIPYALWAVVYHAISSKVFLEAIPAYDLHFVYRNANITEFQRAGAKEVEAVLPYFVPELHHPVCMTEQERARFGCDVAFVGHCEPDHRIFCIDALVRAGLDVRAYGSYWERYTRMYDWRRQVLFPPVYGLDYSKAIRGAKVALAVYSRRHRDPYTRRCFEIPAIGTCMAAERSDPMLNLFREDQEVAYFSTSEELVRKINSLLNDEGRRKDMARRASLRVHDIGADVYSWARRLLETVGHYM